MRKSESRVEVSRRRSDTRESRLVLEGTSKCGSNLAVTVLAIHPQTELSISRKHWLRKALALTVLHLV